MNASSPDPHRPDERGMALVIAVMFLLLTAVLAGTFMVTATGERALSSNVRVAKGSLYAADAGVRVAQRMVADIAQTKLDSLVAIWPGSGPVITAPNSVFPAGSLNSTSTTPNFTASATVAFTDSELTDTAQVYNYLCTVNSTGRLGFLGQRRIQNQAVLRVSASRGSFADFLLFTHIHTLPSGGAIWFTSSSHFDGRVHTNGQFRFGYQPVFEDLATSVNSKAWYYNNGSPVELAANNNGTTDVPSFFGGFTRNAASIPLPPNAYNQQNAALGPPLLPTDSLAPSNATINTQLGTGAGSSPPPNGIYVVKSGGAVTGGIYVQGNLDQYLMSIDGFGRQVYTLRQGVNTTTVTLVPGSNQTIVTDGSGTNTYSGLPRGISYVNGSISDLRGPDRSAGVTPPAIGVQTQLLIAATGDIVLQRDLTSENYNAATSVLGLYSSAGNIRVGTSAPNDMEVDAFVMACGANGAFQVDNYSSGSPRGTFHLRGGSVTKYYGAFFTFYSNGTLKTGYARDFHYDRRGIIPPFYPITNRFSSDRPTARNIVWKEI
jgi:Tfp pilus assembly protein PilX